MLTTSIARRSPSVIHRLSHIPSAVERLNALDVLVLQVTIPTDPSHTIGGCRPVQLKVASTWFSNFVQQVKSVAVGIMINHYIADGCDLPIGVDQLDRQPIGSNPARARI